MNADIKIHGYSHTPRHDVKLFSIATQMKSAKLPDKFIAAAIRTALDFEGVSDLIVMWAEEDDPRERDEIIADIQEMIDYCAQEKKAVFSSVKLNDLEKVAKHIREFKDTLLSIVTKKGGITRLAELTGIPQPSLSRFFNSNAIPQRSTLLKIGKALKIDAIPIPLSRK